MDLRGGLFEGNSNEALAEFYKRLRLFIKHVIVSAPCEVQLISSIEGCEPLHLVPGWVEANDDAAGSLRHQAGEALRRDTEQDPSLSSQELSRNQGIAEKLRLFDERFVDSVRWWGPFSGDLPSGLGRYTMSLPYFDLDGHASLAYLYSVGSNVPSEPEIYKLLGNHGLLPASTVEVAVSGFRVDLPNGLGLAHSWRAKVDILDDSQITVQINRRFATMPNETRELISRFISAEAAKAENSFLEKNSDSIYHSLNTRILGRHSRPGTSPTWAVSDGTTLRWRAISFPCAVARFDASAPRLGRARKVVGAPEREEGGKRWSIGGLPLTVCPQIKLWRPGGRSLTTSPFSAPPDVVVQGIRSGAVAIMAWLIQDRPHMPGAIQKCTFPPEWRNVVALLASLNGEQCLLLNHEHQAVLRGADADLQKAESLLSRPTYEVKRKDVFPAEGRRTELLSSPSEALVWLLACLTSGKAAEVWPVVMEQDPAFLPGVWAALGIPNSDSILYINAEVEQFSYDLDDARIVEVTPVAAKVPFFPGESSLRGASSEWRIAEEPVVRV